MSTPLFDSTRNLDAHIFIDADMCNTAYEDRADFIARSLPNMLDTEHVYMIYVGGGFCPLAVAVVAWNESDAYSAMEEYMRNHDRLGEIGEDDPEDQYFGEYESVLQEVPRGVVVGLTPPPPPTDERIRYFAALDGRAVRVRDYQSDYRMTGDVKRKNGDRRCEIGVTSSDKAHAFFVVSYNIILV